MQSYALPAAGPGVGARPADNLCVHTIRAGALRFVAYALLFRPVSRLRPLFPYLTLTLFAFIAAEPLARAAMTCSDDGSFHLLRAVELGALIQSGHFFPRWSAHMAHGYGFPFYNFYAPLSSYFVVALHVLGLAYPTALKLAFGLGLWLAGIATFLFVRRQWGERAGVVAGVAYLFAPYLAYDVLYRANLAESFAFVWPPLVLWGIHSSVVPRSGPSSASPLLPPTGFLLTCLFYAALILTHNIFALIASPLFAGYVILLAWQNRSMRIVWQGAMALLIGIALSAYFWLPAIVERSWVHSDRLLVPPVFTWHTNFLSLRELLVLPHPADPLLINPSPVRGVGLLPVLLGLPGVVIPLIQRKKDNTLTTVLFFALALAGYGVMTLSVSTPIWQLIRPLELVQFPWRMLGPAALCAAILIGASIHALEERLATRPAFRLLPAEHSFFLIFLFAGNLAWWYPRYCPSDLTGSVADLLAFEDATHTIGTTAKGEYLPRTVDYLPEDDSLRLALQSGAEPSRLLIVSGAAEVTSPIPPDPLNATFQIIAKTETSLVYQQFYYPGWRITIDGRPVSIQITSGEGLMAFTLSPGAHTVRVVFGLTPLRATANAVSLLTLIALIGVGSLGMRSHPLPPTPRASNFSLREVGLVAALLMLKLAFIDRYPNPLRQSAFDGESVATAPSALRADFAGGVRLHGYGLSTRRLPSGESLDVTAYASVWESSLRRYWPNFVIEDADGFRWDDAQAYPPRWHREPTHTPFWPLDQYAQWARHLTLLPGAPPGDYQLWGDIFSLDTLQIASLLDEQGNAIAPRFSLGTLTVTRPAQPALLQPEHLTPHAFGPLTLLGYNFSHDAVNAGDAVELTLYWTCATAPTQDYVAHLEWRDAAGNVVQQVERPPLAHYPTSLWQAGDQWRGQHRLIIPAALADGEYSLSLSILGATGAQTLSPLQVSAPARAFARPPVEVETGAVFEGVGRLEGYALQRADQQLTFTLIWNAATTPAARYNVFVHLADANGRVWTQSDAIPAQWTRPTTGWLAGEYIEDVHMLLLPNDLPGGDYTLWVGLYDPAAGQRVRVSGPGATGDHRVNVVTLALP